MNLELSLKLPVHLLQFKGNPGAEGHFPPEQRRPPSPDRAGEGLSLHQTQEQRSLTSSGLLSRKGCQGKKEGTWRPRGARSGKGSLKVGDTGVCFSQR